MVIIDILVDMLALMEGDVVELLDEGDVICKGTLYNVNHQSTLHGLSMPTECVNVSITHVYNPAIETPYPPPHKLDLISLGDLQGYIVTWPCFALVVTLFLASINLLHHP